LPVSKNRWRHGKIVFNVCLILGAWVRQTREWSVAAGDPGTKLSRRPDTLRGPDVAVIRKDREPQGRGAAGWLEGAPDVAVEVVGDAQFASDLLEQAVEYLNAGGRLVWILDGDRHRVVEVLPEERFRLYHAEDTLTGGEVLPGFSARVAEFFEGLPLEGNEDASPAAQ
ncbi:MAG TPA: Uma2 family endonuclease, partial [Armatimonadota bacterium]|nr:Uma2 family endonuclease [Armatimonadota bacterium]